MAVVDTNHWDTVYVADFDVVNSAILKQGTFPATFSYTDSATKVAINGAWSDWALDVGGSGSLIHMNITAKSGSATGVGEHVNLEQAVFKIQFELEQVLGSASQSVNDPTAKTGTGKPKVQQFPTTKLASNAGESTIAVLNADYPCDPESNAPVLKDILKTIFQNYFNANIGEFQATFHVMMINEKADKDSFQWLKPSAISYAVAVPTKGATISNSAFGVLALTDGGQPGRLQTPTVDIAALVGLPAGSNSAFVISKEKVTRHMLLKGAISTIQGSTDSDFVTSDSGVNITNTKELTWGHFETKKGVISPKISANDFLMRLDGDHIHLEINNARYSPSAGITVYMNLEQDFGFKSVKRSDGKFIFIPDLKTFGNPKIHSNVSVSTGLEITEIVIGAVAVVAALAGGLSALSDLVASSAETSIASAEAASIEVSAVDEGSLSAEDLEEVDLQSSEDADEGVNDPTNADQVQKGGFLRTQQFRIGCAITAGIAGVTAAGIAVSGPITNLEYNKIPAFDDFAANVLGSSKFPSLDDYELLGASLRDSLVCGIKLQ